MTEQSRLFDLPAYAAKNFPKADFFTAKVNGEWKPMSTKSVVDAVDRISIGLNRLGIKGNSMQVEHQDKVALISKNRPEWLMLDLACQQLGVILCPIYPTTNPAEIEFIFNDAGIKCCFASGKDIIEKLQSVAPNIPSLKNIYSFDKDEGAEHWETIFPKNITETERNILAARKHSVQPKTCATIIYTSGTTGTPKGVMLSHHNIVSNVMNSRTSFPFEDNVNGRALSFLPLNHIFEKMVSYIYIGTGHSIYFAESLETIGENLKEVKPSVFCTVPRLLEKVYEKIMAKGAELTGFKKKLFYWSVALANRYEAGKAQGPFYAIKLAVANKLVFSKWREALGNNIEYVITGGAACQVRLLRIFNAAKIPLYEGYGPTENSPVISVNRRGKNGMKFGTVGPVVDGQIVKLEPDGEICVKGPSVMMGYYNRPELTAETLIDGWLHTGDIGVFDGKFLKITDRKKELFKTSGGKYVAPQPIENKLKESPLIEQVIIIGAEQKYTAALIVASSINLSAWMATANIPFTNLSDAVRNPAVLKHYKETIDKYNVLFNPVEQVKKFELLPNEWTIETGELTPTLKLKRKVIMEKYRDAVDRIYG